MAISSLFEMMASNSTPEVSQFVVRSAPCVRFQLPTCLSTISMPLQGSLAITSSMSLVRTIEASFSSGPISTRTLPLPPRSLQTASVSMVPESISFEPTKLVPAGIAASSAGGWLT